MPNRMRRVLVIEDDWQTASELGSCLGAAGYDVTIASDGEKGLRFGRAAEYVVMTVDRILPGMDGEELARQLKAMYPECDVLVFSAFDVGARAESSPYIDHFLAKMDFRDIDGKLQAVARDKGLRTD